jgi:hypothetical protein
MGQVLSIWPKRNAMLVSPTTNMGDNAYHVAHDGLLI